MTARKSCPSFGVGVLKNNFKEGKAVRNSSAVRHGLKCSLLSLRMFGRIQGREKAELDLKGIHQKMFEVNSQFHASRPLLLLHR